MKNTSVLRILLALVILCAFRLSIKGQALLSGTINAYTPVSAINTTVCPAILSVASASAFSIGDKVLIIQMKGAQYDTSNTSSFGNIVNLNGAGNHEIAKITAISGNQITINGPLSNYYDVNGKVQMVLVPFYANANINGLLSCQPWDGSTGGVLIFEVQNNLVFNSDIDVSGTGFRGGSISNNPDGSCGTGSFAYHYPLIQPFSMSSWAEGGAEKGEGIGEIDSLRRAGRGPLVNGGGGGNKHNTGGGGGSNFTAGGVGGNELQGCTINYVAGIGGKDLSAYYFADKIFAGGGGGCGDYNNAVGSNGQNGGGIVIIIAKAITGNNYKIKANGNDVIVVGSGIADGAGGGGGGGAVFLNCILITGLNVEAKGGKGGDQNPWYGCVGPGGGGGTGALLTTMATLTGVNYSLTPGNAGLFLNSSFTCYLTTYGAAAGATNTIGPITNAALVYTQDSAVACGSNSIGKYLQNTINLVVYPDPANSFIAWKTNTNKSEFMAVRIYDCSGRLVFDAKNKQEVSDLNGKINIEKLDPGVYFVEFNHITTLYRERFVKTD